MRTEQLEQDPLLFGVVNFFRPCGHLFAIPAVEDADVFAAQSARRAGGIHGDIAAPDYGHVLPRTTGVSTAGNA